MYNRSSNYLRLEKLFGLDKLQTSHPDQPPDEVKKYEAMHTLVIEFHVALCGGIAEYYGHQIFVCVCGCVE